jgi:hypothetical protein
MAWCSVKNKSTETILPYLYFYLTSKEFITIWIIRESDYINLYLQEMNIRSTELCKVAEESFDKFSNEVHLPTVVICIYWGIDEMFYH